MVIGNGLIAKAFEPGYSQNNRFLIFASGVSNSGTAQASEFNREASLLEQAIQQHPEKILVYFGTCSVYDASLQHSPYVQHKLAMETMIQSRHSDYHIFRLANLAGKTNNPHTFLNYFAQHIQSGTFFYLWKHAWRNVMDVTDVVTICHHILQHGLYKNEVVNIVNPVSYKVMEIVNVIEEVLQKKGNYELVDKTSRPEIDTTVVQQLAQELHIPFNEKYLSRIVNKYFAST
jgi:nucleoside-diphosphate-sugar epimerase